MLCSDFKCNFYADGKCWDSAAPSACTPDTCSIYGECVSCQMLPDMQCNGLRNSARSRSASPPGSSAALDALKRLELNNQNSHQTRQKA